MKRAPKVHKQTELSFVDRNAAYALVESELIAAGVSIISFQHLPKGGQCEVGAWYHGGPMRPGSLKWVADNCEPRSAVEARLEAAATGFGGGK
jgi:hypothetical protein